MMVRTRKRGVGVVVWAIAVLGAMVAGCSNYETLTLDLDGNPVGPTDPTTTTESPAFTITDLIVGTGDPTVLGDLLTVEHSLWLYDDTQPDNKGQFIEMADPSTYLLGSRLAIPGFEQGVVGMQTGGERRLVVPPELGFGVSASGDIPPNASLLFDPVRLLRVDPVPSFTITDLVVGVGAEATTGATVSVEYVGWLWAPTETDAKGTQFDASAGTPLMFVLGEGTVIPGWDQGLVGMRVGGERRLLIPPDLAYGTAAAGQIPPYATVLFDVELLGVE